MWQVCTQAIKPLALADYPIADKEWTAEYEEELRQNQIIEEEMQNRLDGTTPLDEWYVFVDAFSVSCVRLFEIHVIYRRFFN